MVDGGKIHTVNTTKVKKKDKGNFDTQHKSTKLDILVPRHDELPVL